MIKTYMHTTMKQFSTSIMVKSNNGERKEPINFIGGSSFPNNTNGTFSTADKNLQEAMEKSPAFNKQYTLYAKDGKPLVKDEVTTPSDLIIIEQLKAVVKEQQLQIEQLKSERTDENITPDITLKDEKIAKQEAIIVGLKAEIKNLNKMQSKASVPETKQITVPGIDNIQKAKIFLSSEPYNVPANKMPNATAVLNRAKELDIVFIDLPQ